MIEKQFIIPQSMVSALLAYLQKRPYEEVAQAIPALMRLDEIKPKIDPIHDGGHRDSDVHLGVQV